MFDRRVYNAGFSKLGLGEDGAKLFKAELAFFVLVQGGHKGPEKRNNWGQESIWGDDIINLLDVEVQLEYFLDNVNDAIRLYEPE